MKADPTEIVFNEESQDLDFRVETDNSSATLFVHGEYDGVGIHTTSPVSFANAQAVLFIEDNTNPAICLSDTGQADDYYFVASGNRMKIVYGEGSNTGSTVSQVDLLSTYNDSTGVVINEQGGDRDFRVEGNNHTHAIFLEASSDRVGINESSPDTILHISDSSAPTIRITNTDTTVSSGQTLSEIQFEGSDVSTDADGIRAKVTALSGGIGGFTSLQFFTAGENTETLTRCLDLHADRATFNEAGGDVDFRVESDNVSNMLHVDAGNNRLNIGGSPNSYSANRVNIYGDNTNPPSTANGNLAVYAVDSQASGNGGCITLGGRYTDAGAFYQFGAIQAVKKNSTSGNAAGLVKLYYVDSTNGTNPFLEASEDGITFNEAGLDDDFRVESDSNTHMLFVDAGINGVGIATSSPNSSSALTVGGSAGDGSPPLRVSSTIAASSTFNYVFQGHVTDLPNAKRAALSVGKAHSGFNQTIMGHYHASDGSTSNYGFLGMHNADDSLIWTGNGYVGIGNTNPAYKFSVFTNAMANAAEFGRNTDASARQVVLFRSNSQGAHVGSITITNSATAYNTSSDHRLKENVETLSGAITRVKTLKPKRFSWIVEEEDSANVDGFLAHEAQTVVPEAVSGTHNEAEAIGNITDGGGNTVETGVIEPEMLDEGHTWTATGTQPVYQGIDQSKLVPLLTAALQEAIAKIETLEAKVTALENA